MQKVAVIGDGINNAGIKVLAAKGVEVIVVDRIEDAPVKLVHTNYEPQFLGVLVEDRNRHMKNSPYPAKKRGKSKRNKY